MRWNRTTGRSETRRLSDAQKMQSWLHPSNDEPEPFGACCSLRTCSQFTNSPFLQERDLGVALIASYP